MSVARAPEAAWPRARAQFTALYTGTLLVVLVGGALALRFALHATLARQFTDTVTASATLVQRFFRLEIAEYRSIEGTLAHIAGELVVEERAIRIRRPDGSLYQRVGTPVRRAPLPPLAGPVRVVRLPLEPGLAPGWQIEVEASEAPLRALLARLDRWFVAAIALLTALAALAGWWLTGRTLRPVGEALAQQRRFLADAAHELRTPIARLRARLELAQGEPAGGGPRGVEGAVGGAGLADALAGELQAASRQVDELLLLAQADAAQADEGLGQQVVRLAPLFLDDVVADALAHWAPDARHLGMTLACARLEETPVQGDALWLARLVGVLVDNALRYGTPGGTVALAAYPAGRDAVLEVVDDGIGIPVEERGRLFDRFYRGREARRVRPNGSGLGLSIAAWVAAAHRGTVSVTAVDPRGSRFTVRIPLRDGRAGAVARGVS